MPELIIALAIILIVICYTVSSFIQWRQYTKRRNDSDVAIVAAMKSIQDAMSRDEKSLSLLKGYSDQVSKIIDNLSRHLDGLELERQVETTYGTGEIVESQVHKSRHVGIPVILLPLKILKSDIDLVIQEKEQIIESSRGISNEMYETGLLQEQERDA